MGRKITIDSASLMNKALELIEAHHLFGVDESQLDVLVNPQSALHGLIELTDGTLILCCSAPDMRLAIQYALSYPRRLDAPTAPCDLAKLGKLDFEAPDRERFPSIELAREAMRRGAAVPAVLNAANDAAVSRFLNGEIAFCRIWDIVEKALGSCGNPAADSLEDLIAADLWARNFAQHLDF
jgi:1-deoxy-D-xylulose-5-phosphate reductoisomerase